VRIRRDTARGGEAARAEKLLAPISAWSDQWYKALGNGTIATLATGAWMPADLESGVAAGSGQWAVAPLP
jgi:multiple sugar transport system substrate-binding protein